MHPGEILDIFFYPYFLPVTHTLVLLRYGPVIRFPFYIFCCWPQGTCAFIRMAGIVRGSVGGACINSFTFLPTFTPDVHKPFCSFLLFFLLFFLFCRMATCKGCCKMGYPLSAGYCGGCRGSGEGGFCRHDRERGWNRSNRVVHIDPKPLLGDLQFAVGCSLKDGYPHRRHPMSLCDCLKCKQETKLRRDAGFHSSPHRSLRRDRSHSNARSNFSPSGERRPYPMARSRSRSASHHQQTPPPYNAQYEDHYGNDYGNDYGQEERIRGEVDNANYDETEELAYRKLWSAFHTIRGAVLEQQDHENNGPRHIQSNQRARYEPTQPHRPHRTPTHEGGGGGGGFSSAHSTPASRKGYASAVQDSPTSPISPSRRASNGEPYSTAHYVRRGAGGDPGLCVSVEQAQQQQRSGRLVYPQPSTRDHYTGVDRSLHYSPPRARGI